MQLSKKARFSSFSDSHRDLSLSILLAVQVVVMFVIVPLVASHTASIRLMDSGLLLAAALCAVVYAESVVVLILLVSCPSSIILAPTIWSNFMSHSAENAISLHEAISFVSFFFNAVITVLVTRQTFAAGQITRHRVLGAVLVYLIVAVLFSIAYDLLDTFAAGAIRPAAGGMLTGDPGVRTAQFIYFSLTTVTTCGYGDLVPIHPVARSLASLEAVFGQLFPATFVSGLIALHLTKADGASSAGGSVA